MFCLLIRMTMYGWNEPCSLIRYFLTDKVCDEITQIPILIFNYYKKVAWSEHASLIQHFLCWSLINACSNFQSLDLKNACFGPFLALIPNLFSLTFNGIDILVQYYRHPDVFTVKQFHFMKCLFLVPLTSKIKTTLPCMVWRLDVEYWEIKPTNTKAIA